MKVWVLGRGYPNRSNNMLGSFELEQAKMLHKFGYEVTYFIADLRSIRHWRKFGYYLKEEDGISIATASLPIAGLLVHERLRQFYFVAIRKHISKLLRKKGAPDIIHIHYPAAIEYKTVKKAQQKGAKVIITEHWSRVQQKALGVYHLANLRDFVKHADAVCCVGSALKQSIIELTGTKKDIFIIPNAVSEAFQVIDNNHEGFRFIASGRLVQIKQFDKIVDAFIDVFQGNKNVSLMLTGKGREYEKINKIIRQRKAEDQVHLLGMVPHNNMANILSTADALVVYSEMETFCVPVIEAWMCGKPVIATSTTTVFLDNFDKRLGIMVDCNDISSLKKALVDMYQKHLEYDSEWIHDYAKKHFDEKTVFDIISRIYSTVLKMDDQ